MASRNRNAATVESVGDSNTALPEDEEKYREYEQCGFQIGCGNCKSRRWTCSLFNRCNNVKGALVFLSFVAFFQGYVMNGLINIVISTLERRFSLTSSETGLIASSCDIGTCTTLLFVTYVGGRGHKPLWIGWGTLIMGIGSIIFSLPHFIAPTYVISDSVSCWNISSAACGEASVRVYRGFFILSQLLHGIGVTPLCTLALTYLDENVNPIDSSIYHGTFFTFSLIGTGLGYLLGGQLLKLYTNLGETVEITTESVLWVGNWWIGFLIGGGCFFLLSIPLLMYPRQFPGTDKYREDRGKEMYLSSDALAVCENANFGKSFKAFPKSVMIFLKNPTVVFITLAGSMDNGIIAGIATFGPKYLESMYTLPASRAAFIIGLLAIVSSAVGQIVGGVVVSKFKFTLRTMISMCILCSCVAFGCLLVFLMKCENIEIAEVSVPYNGNNETNCVSSSGCGCSTELYDPVCGADNLTYLSYCDAGCNQVNTTYFTNCDRVAASNGISNLAEADASRGRCSHDKCPNMELFGVIVAFGVLFIFLTAQPALQASLRAVPFYQRSFAIGIQLLILLVLGSVPMPNILGAVLDSSCVVWGEQCNTCGSCKVYSNIGMSNYMTIVLVVAKGISLIFYCVAWKTYTPHNTVDSEDTALEPTSATHIGSVDSQQGGKYLATVTGSEKPIPEEHEKAHDNPNFEP